MTAERDMLARIVAAAVSTEPEDMRAALAGGAAFALIPVGMWAEARDLLAPPADNPPTPDALRDALLDLVRFIDQYPSDRIRYGDWACVECIPESDILVDGFRCAYHRAHAILAALREGRE